MFVLCFRIKIIFENGQSVDFWFYLKCSCKGKIKLFSAKSLPCFVNLSFFLQWEPIYDFIYISIYLNLYIYDYIYIWEPKNLFNGFFLAIIRKNYQNSEICRKNCTLQCCYSHDHHHHHHLSSSLVISLFGHRPIIGQ